MRGARIGKGARMAAMAAVAAWALAAGPADAVMPDEVLADAALEARARSLSAGLRCLVCQNQSIDDSEAPLARDLRLLVRERLVAGDSDEQVRAFVVARYGEFVLLKPPLHGSTLLLWLMPLIVLLAAVAAVLRAALRGSASLESAAGPASALTPEEEARLASLLAQSQRTPAEGGNRSAK